MTIKRGGCVTTGYYNQWW